MAFFTSRSLFIPAATDGLTLEVAEPFSLISLRDSSVGRRHMHAQEWYEQFDWAQRPIEAGTYRLRLPVPGSNDTTFVEQQKLLLPGEAVAPVALTAAALLCIQQSGGTDPLKNGWVRCAEKTARGGRVLLLRSWCDGRLFVDRVWYDARDVCIWLVAARLSEPYLSSS